MSVQTPVQEKSTVKKQSTQLANAAILYHPDGYDTSKPKLMGRQAAGESFLKAFSQHAQIEMLACYTQSKPFFDDFTTRVQSFTNRQLQARWIHTLDYQALGQIGCLSIPGPGLSDHAWLRRHGDPRAFSLCGITHTTASDRIMDSIGDLLLAPVQPWDAVICTSHSVRTMLVRLLDSYHEYLCQRLGAKVIPNIVQLPVIPLGIDWQAFQPDKESEVYKKTFKKQHHIKKDDITVLFMGRLSFHAKAHPLPMYLALERAAQQTNKKIHLVLAGWFGNEYIEKQFIEGAKQFCPSVNLITEDARKPEIRKNIWHVADIFTSLSDNIQETFGLTPVEAMAAGLPVVVTDWDGYREAVTHGIHGFTVPTTMPEPGNGIDIALRHAMGVDNYDRYIGQVAQATAVDVDATTQAFITLINNRELRQKMGEAGRQHAKMRYDWPVIIRAYQMLWGELEELRKTTSLVAMRKVYQPVNPLRDDPYRLFAHYPSQPLHFNSMICVMPNTNEELWTALFTHELNALKPRVSQETVIEILNLLQKTGPSSLMQLEQQFQQPLAQVIGWLAKYGVVTV